MASCLNPWPLSRSTLLHSMTRLASCPVTLWPGARAAASSSTGSSKMSPANRPAGQPAGEQDERLETVLALLRADLPGEVWSNPKNWPRWRALLPSVLVATGYHTGTAGEETTVWLLTTAGTYLRRQDRYAETLPLHERAAHPRGRPRPSLSASHDGMTAGCVTELSA